MTENLSGCYLFGSKGRPALNKWINSILPHEYVAYAEPYAGMLGVLLNRPKSGVEIASDLNDRIINWWLMVRDKTEELIEKVTWTPCSEKLFYEYYDTIDEGSDIERAVKLQVVLTHSRMQSDNRRYFGFRISRGSSKNYEHTLSQMRLLRERIKHVTLLNRDAFDILERLSKESHMVIYCDPPYATADTSLYRVDEVRDLTTLLKDQKSKVAVSGYNDEFDHLDWERHEMDVSYAEGIQGKEQPKRTEVLWTNYNAGSQLTF